MGSAHPPGHSLESLCAGERARLCRRGSRLCCIRWDSRSNRSAQAKALASPRQPHLLWALSFAVGLPLALSRAEAIAMLAAS